MNVPYAKIPFFRAMMWVLDFTTPCVGRSFPATITNRDNVLSGKGCGSPSCSYNRNGAEIGEYSLLLRGQVTLPPPPNPV